MCNNGYGRYDRYSDKNFDLIFEGVGEELENGQTSGNVISFSGCQRIHNQSTLRLWTVDFEDVVQCVTLIAPVRKQKSKVNGKTQLTKQHTAHQAGINRTVTRARHIIDI